MGLSASQGRLLLLTAKQSDLEFRAQQISQKRLVLAQQLEEISKDYEDATSNRVMDIAMYTNDEDENGNKVRTTGNLTYKNLLSGTLDNDAYAESAGIKEYSKTGNRGTVSNVAYRLSDPSGAIVVSSVDEIRDEYREETTDTSTKRTAATNNKGIYTVVTEEINQENGTQVGETKKTEAKYFVIKKYKDDNATKKEETALGKVCKAGKEYSIDEAQGIIEVTGDDDSVTYYKLSTGEKIEKSKVSNFNGTTKATAKSKEDDIPMSTVKTTNKHVVICNKDSEDPTKKLAITEGADGKYTVTVGGVIKQRYVVDPGLVTGSSSNSPDPNYLQDCLRNGKYIIEKYNKGDDHNEATWTDIAWDATSNISDRYYTEDDATAKAVYDRKQNEIQNADKKLELELDNVESQRNAVKTEIESVEKVINDNIDKSFKTFA